MTKSKKVVWTERAVNSLDLICEYIERESPRGAQLVRREILRATKSLSKNYSIYQADEYIGDPDIRRLFRWSYKVVYQISADNVVVINVYHTSRNL